MHLHRSLMIPFCLLAIAPGAAEAQDKPASRETGTIVLFDGKSLEGWKKTAFYKPGEVKVEDGAIVMPPGRPMTGITTSRTDIPRTNYELVYEAMRREGSDFFAAATFPVGKSCITLVNGGWGGNVTGLSSLNGSDASENETSKSIKYKDKTWYTFRVKVTDKVIRYAIDGKEIYAVNHEDRQISTRIEVHPNEPLGFATYETGGAVRKVEIRPLTKAEIDVANKVD